MHLTEEEQKLALEKLRKALNAEKMLPEWANAMFVSSSGLEVWVDPKYKTSVPHLRIPVDIDGVPVTTRLKGPGQAC